MEAKILFLKGGQSNEPKRTMAPQEGVGHIQCISRERRGGVKGSDLSSLCNDTANGGSVTNHGGRQGSNKTRKHSRRIVLRKKQCALGLKPFLSL